MLLSAIAMNCLQSGLGSDRPLEHSAGSGCTAWQKGLFDRGLCTQSDRPQKVHLQLKHIFEAPRLCCGTVVVSSVVALRFSCVQGTHVACTGLGHCQLLYRWYGLHKRLQTNSGCLCIDPSIRWQLSYMSVPSGDGKIHQLMCCMQMGSERQKLEVFGVWAVIRGLFSVLQCNVRRFL